MRMNKLFTEFQTDRQVQFPPGSPVRGLQAAQHLLRSCQGMGLPDRESFCIYADDVLMLRYGP